MLDAYGNSCACCGETEQEFLQLDHIHGGGRAHLRELIRNGKGGAGVTLYRAVRFEGYPKDKYRLLCSNCNFVRKNGRSCPHERARIAVALLAA